MVRTRTNNKLTYRLLIFHYQVSTRHRSILRNIYTNSQLIAILKTRRFFFDMSSPKCTHQIFRRKMTPDTRVQKPSPTTRLAALACRSLPVRLVSTQQRSIPRRRPATTTRTWPGEPGRGRSSDDREGRARSERSLASSASRQALSPAHRGTAISASLARSPDGRRPIGPADDARAPAGRRRGPSLLSAGPAAVVLPAGEAWPSS